MASTLATITGDDTSATTNETLCPPVTQRVEIEAERLERTDSEQEESMGEREEHECEMKQIHGVRNETPQPSTSRESVLCTMFADELRDNIAETGNGNSSMHPSIGNGRHAIIS